LSGVKNMKTLIFISNFPAEYIGGAEIQSYNLAKALVKRGHEVKVITRSYKNLPKTEFREGFKIIRFKHINLPIISFLSHFIFALLTIKKNKNDIDVMYCMMLTPNGLVGIFARFFFGINSIPWVRGGDWYLTRNNLIGKRIISFVINNASKIFVQTHKTKKEILSEYPKAKLIVISNGIKIKKTPASGDKIIFVGNLIERKGVKYLIMAVNGLNVELIVVGDGSERASLEKIAGGNVSFIGRVSPDRVNEYMKQGKVFILPSVKGEGLPNVILEAMSFGIPIIATKLAGIPDIINHGDTGFLVETENSKELRKYIKILIDDEQLRKKMSKKCMEEVKKYSWDNMIYKLEKECE